MAVQHLRSRPVSPVTKEMPVRTTVRRSLTPTIVAVIQMPQNITRLGEDVEKFDVLCIADGK